MAPIGMTLTRTNFVLWVADCRGQQLQQVQWQQQQKQQQLQQQQQQQLQQQLQQQRESDSHIHKMAHSTAAVARQKKAGAMDERRATARRRRPL